MIDYKIKQKKKIGAIYGKYGMYKKPPNINLKNMYFYFHEGERLLLSAFLVYLNEKYKSSIFKKIDVYIYFNGDIVVTSFKRIKFKEFTIEYEKNKYYLDLLYLDDENKFLYILDTEEEKILLDRKIKINKIINRKKNEKNRSIYRCRYKCRKWNFHF